MTLSAIVVDDEEHARQSLKRLLLRHPEIEIVAECENGFSAIKAVHEHSPQVIFLDIEMPKLDGFEVLDLLGESAPMAVFVTAHNEHAINAFEANALDYLLKPVSADRMARTLERLQQRLQSGIENVSAGQSLVSKVERAGLQRPSENGPVNRVLIREKGDVFVLSTADIIAFEAADDYVIIYTAQRTFIKQDRLNALEQKLDPRQFCRIHRSSLINLDHIAGLEMEGRDNRCAVMKNGAAFPISRNGYLKLIKVL